MNQILTDEEITLIVRECARGSSINRDGSTSHRIARAIEAAVINKLNSAEPVAWKSAECSFIIFAAAKKDTPNSYKDFNIPLYEHPPAPSAVDREIKLTEERDALKAALEKAGEIFDYYAKHHATKTIPEEDKAKRNYEYRNMCREALKGLK